LDFAIAQLADPAYQDYAKSLFRQAFHRFFVKPKKVGSHEAPALFRRPDQVSLFIDREEDQRVTHLPAREIDQQVLRYPLNESGRINKLRCLMTIRRTHTEILHKIRRRSSSSVSARILKKTGVLAAENGLQVVNSGG
jgi:hypothetical protein